MGIYEPLTDHLMARPDAVWEANFADIERILGRKLPDSAYDHRTWWGNRRAGNHGHANAWREAGWQTRDVDVERKTVRFERTSRQQQGGSSLGAAVELDALFAKARTVTGIEDRDELLKAALTALINRELAQYFASLGGSMPDFEPAPRERPFA